MTFTSYSNFRSNAFDLRKISTISYLKNSGTLGLAAQWHSLWTAAGRPAAGANTSTVCNSPLAGGIDPPDITTGGQTVQLFRWRALSSLACQLMLYDRLVSVAGVPITGGPHRVSTSTLSRYTDGANVRAAGEVTTAMDGSATTVKLNLYTDGGGTAERVGGTFDIPAMAVGGMFFFPESNNSAAVSGVRDCVEIDIATGPSIGVINFLLVQPIAVIRLRPNRVNEISFIHNVPMLPRIYTDTSARACLAMAVFAPATTAMTIESTIELAWG